MTDPKYMTRAEKQAAEELLAEVSFTSTKAVVAGVIATGVAFLGALGVALTPDATGAGGEVTGLEWTMIGTATLVALGAVFGGTYATTNRPKL